MLSPSTSFQLGSQCDVHTSVLARVTVCPPHTDAGDNSCVKTLSAVICNASMMMLMIDVG